MGFFLDFLITLSEGHRTGNEELPLFHSNFFFLFLKQILGPIHQM